MKALVYSLLLFTLLSSSNCKKSSATEDQLPPETTTGAMTFGCKVDGKVFVPKDGNGKPGLYVQYVYLGNGVDEGWHLNIPAFDYNDNPNKGVSILTDSLFLEEGTSYFFNNSTGNPQAFYRESGSNGVAVFPKLDSDSGMLNITKHDKINHILSGNFFFTGTNTSTNQKVSITDGRFDIKY